MQNEGTGERAMPLVAFIFESALIPVALFAGYLTHHDPWGGLELEREQLAAHGQAVLWGLLATLPLVAGLWWITSSSWAPVRHLKEVVLESVAPLFQSATVWQLGLISIVAGIGEELLFRGWLQSWLTTQLHYHWAGVILASLTFGLCHWLNRTYFLLAFLAGVYFGGLFVLFNSLLTPITVHAVYDFIALLWMRHALRALLAEAPTATQE